MTPDTVSFAIDSEDQNRVDHQASRVLELGLLDGLLHSAADL